MVARGDLGVELPLERVPSLQKQMIRLARRAGKPVVVATQNAGVDDPGAGADARRGLRRRDRRSMKAPTPIMLSAESAAGKFPVEAGVATMNRIGEEVERDPTYRGVLNAQRAEPEPTVGDAIADAARQIAETLDLSAIHLLDQFGLDRAARWRASGRNRPVWRSPQISPPAANCRWCGACIAWLPKTRTISTTW